MTPLEEFICESRIQQVIREQYWINKLKPELNCVKAFLSDEERVQQNKEYRETHKEEIKEQNAKYREANKEEIKERYNKFIQENPDKKKDYQKKYRDTHKEQIKEYNKRKSKPTIVDKNLNV
jgi:vacuolar-type H+-ATPase subunit H